MYQEIECLVLGVLLQPIRELFSKNNLMVLLGNEFFNPMSWNII